MNQSILIQETDSCSKSIINKDTWKPPMVIFLQEQEVANGAFSGHAESEKNTVFKS